MILYFNHLDAPYVCVFDIEHDQCELVQFAGLMFKRVGDGLYQLCRNINLYFKHKASAFFQQFSKISQEFLDTNGLEKTEGLQMLDNFFYGIDKKDIILSSLGVFQDTVILNRNGFATDKFQTLCTYELSKTTMSRRNHLTVRDLCNECGCIGLADHNAYNDAIMTAFILSFLLKQGDEQHEDVEPNR